MLSFSLLSIGSNPRVPCFAPHIRLYALQRTLIKCFAAHISCFATHIGYNRYMNTSHSIRFSDEQWNTIVELSSLFGISRNALLCSWVDVKTPQLEKLRKVDPKRLREAFRKSISP